MMKMVHNRWLTLEREYKWKRSTTNLCPLCQEHIETREHILCYQNPQGCVHRAEELWQLKTNLEGIASHPLIVHHLYDIVEKHTRRIPVCHIPLHGTDFDDEKRMKQAINLAIDIGPINLAKGFFPSSLVTAQ